MRRSIGILLVSLWCSTAPLGAQPLDTMATGLSLKPLLVPAALATGGLLVQGNISQQLQQRVVGRYPMGVQTRVDNYLPYAPLTFSLGLSAAGVRGRHSFGEQLLLSVISMVASQAVTFGIKSIARYPRPDDSGYDAFPSGHTSRAFVSATVLHKEYGERSILYSLGGYGVAGSAGVLRVLRNRHWLSDVLFGAGVGIGSTQVVYWGYPRAKRMMTRSKKK